LFVLALLAKTVTCSLPAALILIMLWQRRRITFQRLAPLIPLFFIGLVLALHTAYLERANVGAVGTDFEFTFAERLLIASKALLFYPQKLVVPWPLIFIYPRWELDASRPVSFWPVVVILLMAAAVIAAYRRGRRGPALALAFYGGTLFPALGFFNVYPMRFSFVADHFQYLASLGVIVLVVGLAVEIVSKRALLRIAFAAVLIPLAVLTHIQCLNYADEETLWRKTIQQNPSAWIAHNNLAELLSDRGKNQEALDQLQEGLARAKSAKAVDQIRLNIAITLGKLDRHQEAFEVYRDLQETAGGMEVRLARTSERLGRDPEAEAFYRKALEGERPEEALLPFGLHLLRRGRPGEAIERFNSYLEDHPDDPDVRMFLADACAGAGRMEEAIKNGERALKTARAQGRARMAELIGKRLEQYRSGRPVSPK
jgi:tetratricopeptide (TPR) repeat protein